MNDGEQAQPLHEELIGFSSPVSVSKVLVEDEVALTTPGRGLDVVVIGPSTHRAWAGPGFLVPEPTTCLRASERQQASMLVGDLETRRDETDARNVRAR